jgi:hypothetical protein
VCHHIYLAHSEVSILAELPLSSQMPDENMALSDGHLFLDQLVVSARIPVHCHQSISHPQVYAIDYNVK